MARLLLTPENQIQRLNTILNKVKNLQELDLELLTKAPHAKSWNTVEVIAHLNKAYTPYGIQFENSMDELPELQGDSMGFRARPWQKFFIEGQRPKDTERKWKMKTMKRFQPLLDKHDFTKEKVNRIFEEFISLHHGLKQFIIRSRGKDVSQTKIVSGIGSMVTFYLPESFEFLLCHLERHMVQIDEILAHQKVLA